LRINLHNNESGEIPKKNQKNGKNQEMNLFDKLFETKKRNGTENINLVSDKNPVLNKKLITEKNLVTEKKVVPEIKEIPENLQIAQNKKIEKKIIKGEEIINKEEIKDIKDIKESKKERLNLIDIPRDMRKKLDVINNPVIQEDMKKNMIEDESKHILPIKKIQIKEDNKIIIKELTTPDNQELIKKEEKLILLSNKIKADPEISISMKEKLLNLIENKKEPVKTINELKKEIHRVENLENSFEIKENKDMIRFESKMEIKDWVGKLKIELKNMMDFKIENENKIKLHLNSADGFIKINIEKINNEFVIRSESSDSLRKRVDEILAEVKVEMRERNIEVRFEKDNKEEKENQKNEKQDKKKDERGKEDGSDNANEQRRRDQ
jgi:hypothetical protein